MLHISAHDRPSSPAFPSAIVVQHPAVGSGPDAKVGEVGAPRRVLWSDALRALAVELRVTQDALDPDAEGGAWVVPL